MLLFPNPDVALLCFAASTFLNQVFEADYPKLVRVFSGLLSRIEEFSVAEKPSGYLPSPLDAAALQREATRWAAVERILSSCTAGMD